MPFKDDFVWGAAAAAYQIEGAASAGGRKPSVWDDYCDRPDAVKQGHSGAVACDHYHRFEEDIALKLKTKFFIKWTRSRKNEQNWTVSKIKN